VLYYGIYGVCIGILACRGLSLVSSPLHAMKSQSQIQSSAVLRRRPTAKGVGLRVADSHTGNHLEDGFTLLETIRRLLVIIGRRSHSGFKGEAFEPERRVLTSAKDTIAVQCYGLSANELNEFLSSYPIPSEYDVILPTSFQTIFDTHPGYVSLYTHSFSLANLSFGIGSPSASVNTELPKDVEEPEVQTTEIIADSRNSSKAGVFIVHLGSVVARIKERKALFLFNLIGPLEMDLNSSGNFVFCLIMMSPTSRACLLERSLPTRRASVSVPALATLVSMENKGVGISVGSKPLRSILKKPRITPTVLSDDGGCVSDSVTMSPVVLVHTFTDMAQLEADNSDVVHDMDNENVNIHQVGAQTATVKSPGNNDVGASNVMAWIYNFDYMWTDMGVFNIWERRLKWSFDLLNSLKKETTFIHLNLIPELHIVHSETISNYIKKETTPKCKTRGGSSRPLVKRKLAFRSSSSRVVRTKTSASKDDTPIVSISEDDEGKFSVHLVLSEGIDLLIHPLSSLYVLLGLPNCFELKDANACHLKISAITPPTWKVNKRAREFLQVIEKMSGEADVIKARILVLALREKISSLTIDVKEHKGNLDRMMLKSQKWAGYQVTLLTLKSKVDSIKAEKAKLEAVEVSLLREVEELKQDRRDVVSKVIPYAAMKEPFDLSKAKGYRSSYKKEHTQTSNDFATATFPWLDEFVAGLNPSVFSWP
ncbi:hypothetical protein Tco_0864146, partial [Tanacetum coccineum]